MRVVIIIMMAILLFYRYLMSKSLFFSLCFHLSLLVAILFGYFLNKSSDSHSASLLLDKNIHASLLPIELTATRSQPKIEPENINQADPNKEETPLEQTNTEIAESETIIEQPEEAIALKPQEKTKQSPKKEKSAPKKTPQKNVQQKRDATNQTQKTNSTQQASSATQQTTNHFAKPLHRQSPNYPRRALDRKIEGYVVAKFDIDADGKPQNIQIIESNPKNLFDKETIQTIKKWRYEKIMTKNIEIKIEFKRSGTVQIN